MLLACVLDGISWAYPSRLYRGFNLRRRCRLEEVMKILRRRGDEDDTRCCVDDDDADVEILRRVDARILRRRYRDGDPTTTMLTR